MTDLEINKLLAEIEGLDWRCPDYDEVIWFEAGIWKIFDPLYDKEQAFRLLENHLDGISSDVDGKKFAFWWDAEDTEYYYSPHEKDLSRAICLAVLGKHGKCDEVGVFDGDII